MPGQIDGIPTGGSGGLTMKSGTTDSATIETGLSSIHSIIIYKNSIGATGLIYGIYRADESAASCVYCSSYNSYMSTCSTRTGVSVTVDGGTFTWVGSSTYVLSSGVTYKWIAFGEA